MTSDALQTTQKKKKIEDTKWPNYANQVSSLNHALPFIHAQKVAFTWYFKVSFNWRNIVLAPLTYHTDLS